MRTAGTQIAFLAMFCASAFAGMIPEGSPAPGFALKDTAGAEVNLGKLCGPGATAPKVVILDFWATWCAPCRRVMPKLDELGKKHRAAGLEVIFVNFKEEGDRVRRLMDSSPVDSTVVLDSDGSVGKAYGIGGLQGLPRTVVIGKDGRVRRVFIGERKDLENTLEAEILKALK